MNTSPIKVAISGIGGYGAVYIDDMLSGDSSAALLTALVDPFPERCARLGELKSQGIRVYESLEDLYAHDDCGLLVVASPIHRHCDQTCLALRNGTDVLCEKPLAATVQDGMAIVDATRETGRFAAVGYQWSFSHAIRALKSDFLKGDFGRPVRMKTLVLWPRDERYYSRNNWAGSIRSETGEWILDSPLNNATAHYLHNMLFIAGEKMRDSMLPCSITAELYRANNITNYDTAAMRAVTRDGVEILFYTSHVPERAYGPVFEYQFENARVLYSSASREITVEFKSGTSRVYGDPDRDQMTKFRECIHAAGGGEIPVCLADTALPQTICMNGAQESPEHGVVDFPPELLATVAGDGVNRRSVKGLDHVFSQCYAEGCLPSEHGVSWAVSGRAVNLQDYKVFPSGISLPSRIAAGEQPFNGLK